MTLQNRYGQGTTLMDRIEVRAVAQDVDALMVQAGVPDGPVRDLMRERIGALNRNRVAVTADDVRRALLLWESRSIVSTPIAQEV